MARDGSNILLFEMSGLVSISGEWKFGLGGLVRATFYLPNVVAATHQTPNNKTKPNYKNLTGYMLVCQRFNKNYSRFLPFTCNVPSFTPLSPVFYFQDEGREVLII